MAPPRVLAVLFINSQHLMASSNALPSTNIAPPPYSSFAVVIVFSLNRQFSIKDFSIFFST